MITWCSHCWLTRYSVDRDRGSVARVKRLTPSATSTVNACGSASPTLPIRLVVPEPTLFGISTMSSRGSRRPPRGILLIERGRDLGSSICEKRASRTDEFQALTGFTHEVGTHSHPGAKRTGKNRVVIGGSRGVGLRIVEAAVRNGANNRAQQRRGIAILRFAHPPSLGGIDD